MKNFQSHEEEIRETVSKEEAIRRITQIYHADFDLDNPNFDIYDQLLACEAIDESQKEYERKNNDSKENVSVSGSVNDSYKRKVNFELSENQLKVIEKLKGCNYQTPPVEIAELLQDFF